jgi:hypothetical protein
VRAKLALLLAASLPLGACGVRGERGERERSVPIRMPLAVASAATPSALPVAAPANSIWTHSPSARAAWFGPPNAPVLLGIACEPAGKNPARLVVVRYAPADKDAEALFAVQGSKGILRLPVSAVKVGKEGYAWRGTLDAADPRMGVWLGNGLKATVPGGGQLLLPPMGEAATVISQCMVASVPPPIQSLPNLPSNPVVSPAAR